jgi:hypothetical protein
MIAHASGHIEASNNLLLKIEDQILFPLMTLMMAVAVLVFVFGAFEYISNADEDSAREKGKSHMMYGIIGLVIMVSALGILRIAGNTVGCDIDTIGGCR